MESQYGHLLLIANSKENYSLLASHLGQLGYAITASEDSQQALHLLESDVFDLVLLDSTVPEAEGQEVLQGLKAAGILPHLPVIVVNAGNSEELVERYLALGAQDYIGDLDPILLKTRVNACLDRKRLRELVFHQLQEFNEMEKLADDLKLVILPLGIALSAEKDFDRLLEQIVLQARLICNADGGTLFLRTEDDDLRFAIIRRDSLDLALGGTTGRPISYPPLPLYDQETGTPNYYSVATKVALQGYSANIADIYQANAFDYAGTKDFDHQLGYRTISLLTVPLKDYENEVIGVLQLINAQDPGDGKIVPFDAYHQLVVESLASLASVALNAQILLRRQESLLKLERDLQIGRQIQSSFLPDSLPDLAGWELAVRFEPAREVAGDFYDLFPLLHGRVGLVVADVCEKGVGAALFMALTRSLVRAFAQLEYAWDELSAPEPTKVRERPVTPTTASQPGQLLFPWNARETLRNTVALTNNYIVNNHGRSGMFATLFFGVLDPVTGLLRYVNCGHIPPVIVGRDGLNLRLEPTGPAIGIRANVDFVVGEAHLEPGEILFVFTDGVTEARDVGGNLFREDQLLSLLQPPVPSAVTLLERVEAAVRQHTAETAPSDDITMLAVQRSLGDT